MGYYKNLSIERPAVKARYAKERAFIGSAVFSPQINVKWMGLGELDARMRRARRMYYRNVRLALMKGGRLLAREVKNVIKAKFPAVGYRPKGRNPKYGTLWRSLSVKASAKITQRTAYVAVKPRLLGQAYGKIHEQGGLVYRRMKVGGKRVLIGPFRYRPQPFLFPTLRRLQPQIAAIIQKAAASTWEAK